MKFGRRIWALSFVRAASKNVNQKEKSNMDRRQFLVRLLTAGIASVFVTDSFGQATPFAIRVVRSNGWEQLMQRELCIPGTVYTVDPDMIMSDNPGTKVCYSMELPQRGNQNEISAIPRGTYSAKARLSGKNGPVLELSGVPGRDVIQIHSGNSPDQTIGCILLGDTAVSQAPQHGSEILTAGKCWISGSKIARNKLLALCGWTDLTKEPPARPITVIID
jgi:hypothetical protein